MKRGEIYYANLDPVMGSEQGGVRPVLIIQNDMGNRFSPTVIILPLTSSQNKAPLKTHVPVRPPVGGLKKPSLILCEQVRTIEKKRLLSLVGVLPKQSMALVGRAFSYAIAGEKEEKQEDKMEEDGNCKHDMPI